MDLLLAIAILSGISLAVMLTKAVIEDMIAHQPRERCILCTLESERHPAGPTHRFTRRRVNGYPICHRH